MNALLIDGDICDIHKLPCFNSNALNSVTHITNCRGVFGRGLALSIKNKYPIVFKEYKELCSKNTPKQLLGVLQPVRITDNHYICNLFGQLNYGTEKRQLNYEALYRGLSVQADMAKNTPNAEFYYPKNMGSGLAGGDWNIVISMINSLFGKLPNKVYIVNFS